MVAFSVSRGTVATVIITCSLFFGFCACVGTHSRDILTWKTSCALEITHNTSKDVEMIGHIFRNKHGMWLVGNESADKERPVGKCMAFLIFSQQGNLQWSDLLERRQEHQDCPWNIYNKNINEQPNKCAVIVTGEIIEVIRASRETTRETQGGELNRNGFEIVPTIRVHMMDDVPPNAVR